MNRQIYQYLVTAEAGRAGTNVILEVVNQTSGEKGLLCEWPAGELDVSLKRRFQEVAASVEGLEYFTDSGRLYIGSPDKAVLRTALAALREAGLFSGGWPGLIEVPPPPPLEPVSELPAAQPGRSSAKTALIGVFAALALTLAVYWYVQNADRGRTEIAHRQMEQKVEEERRIAGEERQKAAAAERERRRLEDLRLAEARERERPNPAEVVRPTFDCNKATTASEKLICRDNDLARAERNMVTAYKSALAAQTGAARKQFLGGHLEWFKRYARESAMDSPRAAARMRTSRHALGAIWTIGRLHCGRLGGERIPAPGLVYNIHREQFRQ